MKRMGATVLLAYITSSFILSTKHNKYQVLSTEKQWDSNHTFYNDYKNRCEAWNLDLKQVELIIRESKPIDGHGYHYDFETLPCSYTGECIVKNKKGRYELNAGGVTIITMADTSYWLGYYTNDTFFVKTKR